MNREELIAKTLLDIKAVFLSPKQPFTWASGIKSPIYCDNRLVNSFPKARTIVANALVDLIKEKYPDANCIVGTSTAGISHAAIIAHIMNLPMAYVRNKVKDHGRAKYVEGQIPSGAKVVVIEDLMSTGKSSIEVVEILRRENVNVLGIASIFTYNLELCSSNLKQNNITNFSLSNFNVLSNLALKNNIIDNQDYENLLKFQQNPKDESWIKTKSV